MRQRPQRRSASIWGRTLESALATAHAAPAAFRFRSLEARRTIIGAKILLRTRGPLGRLVDLESTALELCTVEFRNSVGDRRRIVEFDERKPAGLTCCTVDGKEDLRYLADLGKERFDFCLCCGEAKVADKDL